MSRTDEQVRQQLIRLILIVLYSLTFSSQLLAQQCPVTVKSTYENPDSKAQLVTGRILEHSFLGAKLHEGVLECYYGIGSVSLRYKIDQKGLRCGFFLPKKNPLGIRNTFDCLGSTEDCRVICR